MEEAHHSFEEDKEELDEIAQDFKVDDEEEVEEDWRESVGSCVFQWACGLCLSVEVDLHYWTSEKYGYQNNYSEVCYDISKNAVTMKD